MPMVGRRSRVAMVPSSQLGITQQCGTIAGDATAQRDRRARHRPGLEGGDRPALAGDGLYGRTPATGRRSAAPRDPQPVATPRAGLRAVAPEQRALAFPRRSAPRMGWGGPPAVWA